MAKTPLDSGTPTPRSQDVAPRVKSGGRWSPNPFATVPGGQKSFDVDKHGTKVRPSGSWETPNIPARIEPSEDAGRPTPRQNINVK